MGKYSEAVARAQIVAIVRLDNYDRALAVAEALLAGGINAIEYTLTGSGAFAAVSKVRNALGNHVRAQARPQADLLLAFFERFLESVDRQFHGVSLPFFAGRFARVVS
jgi:hypothetical protein